MWWPLELDVVFCWVSRSDHKAITEILRQDTLCTSVVELSRIKYIDFVFLKFYRSYASIRSCSGKQRMRMSAYAKTYTGTVQVWNARSIQILVLGLKSCQKGNLICKARSVQTYSMKKNIAPNTESIILRPQSAVGCHLHTMSNAASWQLHNWIPSV